MRVAVRSWGAGLLALTLAGCGGGGGAPPAPPDLTEVLPASGGVAGGTPLTLTGANLGTGAAAAIEVRVGGVAATDLAVVDAATLTCVAPAGAVGPVDVEVVTDHGADVLPAAFTYHPAPTLLEVSPPRGPVTAGTVLALTGTGFLDNDPGTTEVLIGGAAATEVQVLDDAHLTCAAPGLPGLGGYGVLVRNANGEASLADGFTCVPPPGLGTVALADGPAGGSVTVTLTGSAFDAGVLAVTFGGAPANDVVVASATTLTCRTPAGAVGPVAVAVTTYGGTVSLPAAYTYTVFTPSDPLFASQWHLENTGQATNATPGEDARVRGAWNLGYTGRGVAIGVVDDGMELLHEDLAANVVPGRSWDYGGNDADPSVNEHGTSVAGVCSAVGGNGLGGVGAAPRSRVVGFAVLGTSPTDADIADALARDAATLGAYNNSWGAPTYSGGVLYGYGDAPTSFVNAVDFGLREGRGGLGAVYLKAAGNSGSPSAAFDGTNGLRGMNVIGAMNSQGTGSVYSQPGACILVCAPSNGTGSQPGITTTDRTGAAGYSSTAYTSSFGGTSSATPLVTGVVAQVLEARPGLRWWEVPLVLAESARRNDPGHADWVQNGAGRWVNHQYGFGCVDATAAVNLARTWVPRSGLVSWTQSQTVNALVPKGSAAGATGVIVVPASTGITAVHRATVTVFCDHTVASDLTVTLTSPAGTTSRLATSIRAASNAVNQISGIALPSWRHLGEAPAGVWSLKLADGQNVFDSNWTSWTLTLEGEGVAPAAALTVAKPEARSRPPAPLVGQGEQAWWDGRVWRRATLAPDLVFERRTAGTTRSWLADEPDVVGLEPERDGVRLWRLAPGADRDRLAARAAASGLGEVWPVYRDGSEGRVRVLSGRLLVRWAPGSTAEERAAVARRHGLTSVRSLAGDEGLMLLRLDLRQGSALDAARALLEEPAVAHAEPDWWRPWRPQ